MGNIKLKYLGRGTWVIKPEIQVITMKIRVVITSGEREG